MAISFIGGHTCRIAVAHELCGVGTVDVVHRYPQLVVVLATVVHSDDVWMEKRRSQVGFADEPLTELGVSSHRLGKNFERLATRQPRVFGQIDLTHSPRPKQAHDGEASEGRTVLQRHGRILLRSVAPNAASRV